MPRYSRLPNGSQHYTPCDYGGGPDAYNGHCFCEGHQCCFCHTSADNCRLGSYRRAYRIPSATPRHQENWGDPNGTYYTYTIPDTSVAASSNYLTWLSEQDYQTPPEATSDDGSDELKD